MTDEKLNGIIKALKLCTGIETACKDCPYRASVSPSFSVRCEDTLHKASLEAIEALKSENAALRKQIFEMVRPPVKPNDILYTVTFSLCDGYDDCGNRLYNNGWHIAEEKVTEKNFYRMCDFVRNGKAFFSREAAEAKLKERQGGKE